MARKNPTDESVANAGNGNDTQATDGATPSAAAQSGTAPVVKDERYKKLTVPDGYGEHSGTQMNRKDFILLMAGAPYSMSRSQMTAVIKRIPKEHGGDPNFRYQIVFQTTKSLSKEAYPNLRGGHIKKEAPATAPAEQPTQT